MNLVKTISTEIDSLGRRLVKVLRFGKSDVQTPIEAMPFGTDSNPVKDLIAVYAETGEKGKTVIVGYLNKGLLSEVGGHRIFSTDENGDLATSIYLRSDGTIEMRGTGEFMVRYTALNNGMLDFQSQIQAELVKIATGIAGAGGAYTPGTLNIDISGAKIDEIKTV